MFDWIVKEEIKAANAIILGDKTEEEGRPFKARFLQAGLVKYNFGVCLLKKETIDRFVNTFMECPVIIGHKDEIKRDEIKGTIKNIWFSPEDGWFWCSGTLDDEAAKKVEKGFNVSCQYRITEYTNNTENKLHNGNKYDKEILNGVFEHLAIVENPRYEDAYIAVNAIMASNDHWITIGADEEEGKKGRHVLVKEGETNKEATERKVEEWKEKGEKEEKNISDTIEKRDKEAKEVGEKNKDFFKNLKEQEEKVKKEAEEKEKNKLLDKERLQKYKETFEKNKKYIREHELSDVEREEAKAKQEKILAEIKKMEEAQKQTEKKETEEDRISARHKFQEAGKKRDKVHEDFEKGIGTFEDVEKADAEYEKAYKEFYNYSGEKQPEAKEEKQTKEPKKHTYTVTKREAERTNFVKGMGDTGSYYTNADFVIDKNYVNLKGVEAQKKEDLEKPIKQNILREDRAISYKPIKDFEVGELKREYGKPVKVAKYSYYDDKYGYTRNIYINKKYNDLFKNFELKFGRENDPIYAYDNGKLIGAVMPIFGKDSTYQKAQNEIEEEETEEIKEQLKLFKAQNSFLEQFKDMLYETLAEGIVDRLGE